MVYRMNCSAVVRRLRSLVNRTWMLAEMQWWVHRIKNSVSMANMCCSAGSMSHWAADMCSRVVLEVDRCCWAADRCYWVANMC